MAFPRPDFSDSVIAAAKAHAVACYPNESCGLVIGDAYVACENMASDPENDFKISANDVASAGDALFAVIHSHPDGKGVPSKADMQSQIDTDCIFGIIPCNKTEAFKPVFWGDYLLEGFYRGGSFVEGLIGREFIHGISDCYSLIRAYFWQVRGIKLKEFARDEKWWSDGGDLYRASFVEAGFESIDEKSAAEGDVFIGCVLASVPNHGGIILDRGQGLHHLADRYARREGLLKWRKYITHWLHYTGTET